MWIVVGRLEQESVDKPWVIMDADEETGEPMDPAVYASPEDAKLYLANHMLVDQSVRSLNPVYALNVASGELVEIF